MSSDGPNIGLSKAQRDDVEALVADAQRRSRAADRLATRVGQIPVRTLEVVRASVDTATKLGQSSLTLLSVLLVLFIVHQVFLWVDRDPEKAFDNGALLFEAAELTWDTTSIFYNAAVDVVNAGVLPVWNAAAFYVAEPAIVLVLEIFSLAFTRQHWQGLFSEADFPYSGLDCTASPKAAEWCGRAAAYSARLESAEKAGGYADASGTYAAASRRALAQLSPFASRTNATNATDDGDDAFVFGLATARRLAALGAEGEDNFVAPAFETAALNDALLDFGMLFIVLGSEFTDVFFAVSAEVLTQVFSVLVDAFFMVVRSLMMVLKMLVSAPSPTPDTPHRPSPHTPLARGRVGHAHHRAQHWCRFCHHRKLHANSNLYTYTHARHVADREWSRTVLHRDRPPGPLRRHRPPILRDRLLHAFGVECAARVRRGKVLQGTQHRLRPARLHAHAHPAPPLHRHHGGDAQLAHGQALLWRPGAGHLHRRGAHHRPRDGRAHRAHRDRERPHGQPDLRV